MIPRAAWLLFGLGPLAAEAVPTVGPPAVNTSECAEDGVDCQASGCCKDTSKICYEKNLYWALCRSNCTPGIDPSDGPLEQTPWSCKVVKHRKGPWKGSLQGTTFWDCNGAGCDSTVLAPFVKEKYIYAAPYAPADPADFGGSKYGEKIWMTGASSDSLAKLLGPNADCCGQDKAGSGCGQCLLVRNPTAVNADWTAVVMKKSRCPPESKGCEKGKIHFDLAVPGYENIDESTANVCGSAKRDGTFVSKSQAGSCNDWSKTSTFMDCTCLGLPNKTTEQRLLRRGCEVFTEWGWTSGDPKLEYYPVACPEAWVARVSGAFGSSGTNSLENANYTPWIIVGCVAVAACIIIGILNRLSDRREAKKRYENMKALKARKAAQKARKAESSSGSSSEASSNRDSDARD